VQSIQHRRKGRYHKHLQFPVHAQGGTQLLCGAHGGGDCTQPIRETGTWCKINVLDFGLGGHYYEVM